MIWCLCGARRRQRKKEDIMSGIQTDNISRQRKNKMDSMESDVSYRCIGENFDEGVVACGFMRKRTRNRSQVDFQIGYYSGFFLLSGSGSYVSEKGKQIPLCAGNFVQRLPGEVHSTYVEPDGEWLEFFISFGKGRYELLKGLGLLPEERVSKCPVQEKISECKAHLERLKMATDGELGIVLAGQEQFLLELLRCGQQQELEREENERAAGENLSGGKIAQAAEKGEKTAEEDIQNVGKSAQITGGKMWTADEKYVGKIRQAADMLSANPGANLNMEDVAKQLAIGYETFRKQFRRQMGVSPADFRLQHKMRQAGHMLDAGISIKETAGLMGYADVYTFTRQFTKTMGRTPGEYRRRTDII